MKSKPSTLLTAITLLCLLGFITSVNAQGLPIECGGILQGEFQESGEEHNYFLNLLPGDQLSVQSEGVGDYVRYTIGLYSPSNRDVQTVYSVNQNPYDATGVLSERGAYRISVEAVTLGIYTLYVSCVLGDGTVINAGDVASTSTTNDAQSSSPVSNFSGVGFPGLVPVDFANVARLPLPSSVPMGGAVTPAGGEILGFTLDANASDLVELNFTRLSGNLNLGLVVLSANNEVLFQASLVTSQTLSTRFTVPSAGQYTIGVFRIDLLAPSSPEATAFQIQATLNP